MRTFPCNRNTQARACELPAQAGLGLKPAFFEALLSSEPALGFVEIHAENYMVDGGPFHHYLGLLRERYALSIHGVGLSIGADAALDALHLQRLKTLLDRYQPESFSEHLAWSTHGPCFLNDLLPLQYDQASLDRVCDHIDQVQHTLGRRMLLENPATYLQFRGSSLEEPQFINEVIRRTGCGLLLDVCNIHVSCSNHHWSIADYLHALPLHAVGEIHLAGFSEDLDSSGEQLLIDSHSAPIAQAVWALYQQVLEMIGPVATLIERDNEVPALDVLLAEAGQAQRLLDRQGARQ
ncbi:DUF692 domain-containing protein [Pseudomonas fontis]|uniref:DUF692 domain-containing protein n=1 Tax=Pseudomonas fontis TaxID=2942633 RepID=A0ABT5NWH1_9PSED|nr:DUF692 domain-containing protein [Pseudomonas fontis]MDD0973483.1 DUF692 domain-containing protein [Pseudomonas fontis]MDD0992536.1 DUF692 domain-containing protein [Pseudomonas fontis]